MYKCAFDLDVKCAALTEKKCNGCRFRKTNEELDEGRKKAEARIGRLAPPLRQYLIDKYYGGKSPFKV